MRCPECNRLLDQDFAECPCGHRFAQPIQLSNFVATPVFFTLVILAAAFIAGFFLWISGSAFMDFGNGITPFVFFGLGPPFVLAALPFVRQRGGCCQAVLYPVVFFAGAFVAECTFR